MIKKITLTIPDYGEIDLRYVSELEDFLIDFTKPISAYQLTHLSNIANDIKRVIKYED